MKKSSFAMLVIFLFASGCNSGSDSSKTTETPAEQSAPPAQEVAPVQTENPPHGQPGHVHTEGEPAGATPSGDVKLNPPHGEPGHRCDVAVGAPLPQ